MHSECKKVKILLQKKPSQAKRVLFFLDFAKTISRVLYGEVVLLILVARISYKMTWFVIAEGLEMDYDRVRNSDMYPQLMYSVKAEWRYLLGEYVVYERS